MRGKTILLFFLILTMFLSFTPQTQAKTPDSFIYFIDGKSILDISPDMVIGSDTIMVVHSYAMIHVTYTCGNKTYYDDKMFIKKVFELTVYDDAHLVIRDMDNNIVVDSHIHTLSIGNYFEYIFPLKYQQLAISVCLAFIVSVLLVYACFVNKQRKIM